MRFTKIEQDLFKKYALDVDKIKILGEIEKDDKENLVYHLLLGFEIARKNALKGNLTSSSYACGLILEDNEVYFGVNFNNTRNEISSICAERMALLEAFNSKIKMFNPDRNEKFNYKIKYVLMADYKKENEFWTDKLTPCADCLSWFNACPNLSKDTKICCLKKDENGEFIIKLQDLSDFLPLRNLVYTTIDKISDDLKIEKTKKAKNVIIDDKKLIELYKKTKEVYLSNNLSQTSGQNCAAGIIANNEMFFGKKVDFSKRWFIEPLMSACYKAIEKYNLDTKIDVICYVGEEYTITESKEKVKDGLISIKTLGRINTKFANPNTLIIVGWGEKLSVQTIADYLPCEHKFIHDYEIK